MLLRRVDYDSEPAYCKIFGHHVGYILPIHKQRTQTFSPLVTKFLLFRLISSRNGVFSYNMDVVPKTHFDRCCELFLKVFLLTPAWLIWRHMDQHCNGAAADGSFFKCALVTQLVDRSCFSRWKSVKSSSPPPLPLGPKQCDIVHHAATFGILSHWIMLWVLFGSHI